MELKPLEFLLLHPIETRNSMSLEGVGTSAQSLLAGTQCLCSAHGLPAFVLSLFIPEGRWGAMGRSTQLAAHFSLATCRGFPAQACSELGRPQAPVSPKGALRTMWICGQLLGTHFFHLRLQSSYWSDLYSETSFIL